MYQQTYYVPKNSGTLADPLVAYGLATLLDAIVRANTRSYSSHITIEDQGSYVLHLKQPIQEEWLTKRLPTLAWPVLRTPKPKDESKAATKPKPEKKPFPEGMNPINYNAIWEGIREVNDLMAVQKQQGGIHWDQIEELRDSLRGKQPHRDVALLIGDYRMQVEGIHNQAVRQWYDTVQAGYQPANMRAILQMYAAPQTNVDAIAKTWAKEVKLDGVKLRLTASQVFNPSMGKGQNRAKADQLAMGNEEYFWLVEYLKAVGLFVATAPRAFPDEDMRKTYVLAPAHIELADHDGIFARFKRTLDGLGVSPIKADILTSLDYASAYLSYGVEARREDSSVELNPRNSVKGFYVASYVLLSQNSFTTINLSFLRLPPWLSRIGNQDDVVAVQEVIDEHRGLVRRLQEKHQEGNLLLDAYRDFLTGHRLDSFFDFCSGYGEHLLRTLPENRFTPQCSITSLNEIFRRIKMSDHDRTPQDDLTEFSSTSKLHLGFHEIAYAIRQSTVIPQRRKANNKAEPEKYSKPLYDIRYGLGNNLRRKTDSAADFMEALTEFLHSYNAETEQVFENTSDSEERRRNREAFDQANYRRRVSPEHLDDVLALVKQHGPRLVCNMLVAYGYATTRRKGADDSRSEETDDQPINNTTGE